MSLLCLILLILLFLSIIGAVISLVSMILYFKNTPASGKTKGKKVFHILILIICIVLANIFAVAAFVEFLSYGLMMSM